MTNEIPEKFRGPAYYISKLPKVNVKTPMPECKPPKRTTVDAIEELTKAVMELIVEVKKLTKPKTNTGPR